MSAEHDPGSRSEESEPAGASSVDDPLSRPLGNWDSQADRGAASATSESDSGSGKASQVAPAEAAPSAPTRPAEPAPESTQRSQHVDSPNMLPGRQVRRSGFERLVVRLIATCGVVAIGVAIAAIMVSSKSQGWIVGLVVAIVSVVLSALLWSSRQL